jgi:hypothetical protein
VVVGGGEIAAGEERDAEGAKEAGAHQAQVGVGPLARPGSGAPLDSERRGEARRQEGQGQDGRRLADAGQRPDASQGAAPPRPRPSPPPASPATSSASWASAQSG